MFYGQLMGSPSDGEAIEEFTRRKAVFRQKWNRLVLVRWLPLALGFGVLRYFGVDKRFPVVVVALALGAIAAVGLRASRLVRSHHTCPVCDQWQRFGYFVPHRSCRRCGTKLSSGPST